MKHLYTLTTLAAILAAAGAHAAPMSDNAMPGMDMAPMSMSSAVDINDPMNREGSGTSWLPDSTPMYGKMWMKPNGDMIMLHGAIMPRFVRTHSKRGDEKFDAPNWLMGMYSHPLDSKSQIGLHAMLSLDPLTEGGIGYPLNFQTGETWGGQPLHDRQHPHDLFSELSATYSRMIGGGNSAYLYLAYPGEPALGPPTFMHRLLAYDYADAPIGHHWQDATHVTFGVATAGLNLGGKMKFEGSVFTGREPDENRYDFDTPRWDSYSGRFSYNSDKNNAYQVSYGFVKNAEGDGSNQHRTTASWLYNKPLGEDSNFTTALVWGRNDLEGEGQTNSYLFEADYQRGADTVFSRIENIQKSGHELVIPDESLHERKFNLGAYTAGYVRDLTHGKGIDTGLGAAVTLNTKPSALDPFYGGGSPVSFQVFFRLRPSRIKMNKMDTAPADTMPEMDQSGGAPMPGMDHTAMPGMDHTVTPPTPEPLAPVAAPEPAAPVTPAPEATPEPAAPTPAAPAAVTIAKISAAIAPAPPKARQKNLMTVTLTDRGGASVQGAVVTGSVAMTSMDMGTSQIAFTDRGDGTYTAQPSFSMAGPWRVTVYAVVSKGGKPVIKTFTYGVAK
ncbi:MAG: FixH family protein [Capsulimonas sp.]|uniref:FixH family protein n=1 Tax=Capsulimonas sp. TaxID=2494211 RepID=UPI0032641718